jgi:predicted S18 family serine protease
MTNNRGLWIVSSILLILLLVNSYYIYDLNRQVSTLRDEIRDISRPIVPSVSGQNELHRSSFSIAEKGIPIVAVSNDESGVMSEMNLRLIPGSNDILINTNPFLEPDVQYAVKTAVTYPESRDPNYKFDKDFVFNFTSTKAQLIGGESAGAAAAIVTIAALENKELKNDAVITGTINEDGTIGEIGGVLEKTKAVDDAGYKYFLIPEGQSNITYYERQVQRQSTDLGFDILRSKYVPKTLNLAKAAKDELGLNIIEVSNVDEALPYFIED